MTNKEATVYVFIAALVAAVVGGIVFALYSNAKSNREVKQQKFNVCVQAGGTPIIAYDTVTCVYGKANTNG